MIFNSVHICCRLRLVYDFQTLLYIKVYCKSLKLVFYFAADWKMEDTAIPTKKPKIEKDIYQQLKNSVYTKLQEVPTNFEMYKLSIHTEEGRQRIMTLHSLICENKVKHMEHYAILGIELAHQNIDIMYSLHLKKGPSDIFQILLIQLIYKLLV